MSTCERSVSNARSRSCKREKRGERVFPLFFNFVSSFRWTYRPAIPLARICRSGRNALAARSDCPVASISDGRFFYVIRERASGRLCYNINKFINRRGLL